MGFKAKGSEAGAGPSAETTSSEGVSAGMDADKEWPLLGAHV